MDRRLAQPLTGARADRLRQLRLEGDGLLAMEALEVAPPCRILEPSERHRDAVDRRLVAAPRLLQISQILPFDALVRAIGLRHGQLSFFRSQLGEGSRVS